MMLTNEFVPCRSLTLPFWPVNLAQKHFFGNYVNVSYLSRLWSYARSHGAYAVAYTSYDYVFTFRECAKSKRTYREVAPPSVKYERQQTTPRVHTADLCYRSWPTWRRLPRGVSGRPTMQHPARAALTCVVYVWLAVACVVADAEDDKPPPPQRCCLHQDINVLLRSWSAFADGASTLAKMALVKAVYDVVHAADSEAALLLLPRAVGEVSLADIEAGPPRRQLALLHVLRWFDTTINHLHADSTLWSHLLHTARNNLQWMLAPYEHFHVVADGFTRTIADNAPLFTNSHVWQNCADTIAEAAVEAATRARQEHVYAACRFVPRVVVETGRKGADDDGDGFEEGKWGTEENAVIPSENNIKGRILLTQSAKGGPTTLFVDVRDFDWSDDVLRHGMHVHWRGDVEDECRNTAGHYNPLSAPHGGPDDVVRHMGDLGNVEEDYYGVARTTLVNSLVSLVGEHSVVGRSIVIHRYEDDLGRGGTRKSIASGNVGARIGCCAITKQYYGFAYAECKVYSDTGVAHQPIEGRIQFKQAFTGGNTFITVDLDGFDASDTQLYHGIHVHADSDLGNQCKGCGDHFDPENRSHGAPWAANRHTGDLGNLRENTRGEVKQEMIDHKISLFGQDSIIGLSVVIHELEDDMGVGGDLRSIMTGSTGPALGCCIIEEMDEPDPYRLPRTSIRPPRT